MFPARRIKTSRRQLALKTNHLLKSQIAKTCIKKNADRHQIGTYLFKTCFPVTANPNAIPPIAPATAADLGQVARYQRKRQWLWWECRSDRRLVIRSCPKVIAIAKNKYASLPFYPLFSCPKFIVTLEEMDVTLYKKTKNKINYQTTNINQTKSHHNVDIKQGTECIVIDKSTNYQSININLPVFDTVSLKQIRPIWVFVSQDTTAESGSSRPPEPFTRPENTLVAAQE
ncbi:hypothetical protein LXL04_026097 [Taraxacum kok-saghyz]